MFVLWGCDTKALSGVNKRLYILTHRKRRVNTQKISSAAEAKGKPYKNVSRVGRGITITLFHSSCAQDEIFFFHQETFPSLLFLTKLFFC